MSSLVDIVELPPQEAPKQLTARVAPHNLHEHFLAFLNANNESGFLADEILQIQADTIVDLLIDVSKFDVVTETKFKLSAKRLKKTSNGTIKHSRALDIVSRVFGYLDFHEVMNSSGRAGGETTFRNRRNRSSLNLHKLLGLKRPA